MAGRHGETTRVGKKHRYRAASCGTGFLIERLTNHGGVVQLEPCEVLMRGRCADDVSAHDVNPNVAVSSMLRIFDDSDDDWCVVDLPADRRNSSIGTGALADDTCWERNKNMMVIDSDGDFAGRYLL